MSAEPVRVSPERRRRILAALRRGSVPERDLDTFAVGLERFEPIVGEELEAVASSDAMFKAVRGEYGSGKTFFSRWMQGVARQHGFCCAEVQISETETPLHRYETIYRRLIERLATPSHERGALRAVLDGWFFTLEEDVLAEGEITEHDHAALAARTEVLLEQRLAEVSRSAPALAAALRAYRQATVDGDHPTAEGLLAWISGTPTVAASVKRRAGIKGDIDHDAALSFLQGLLVILRDSGLPGLVLVLDEVETLQRVRTDVRERGLNALRQFIDEIDAGRFPGLSLWITGTPAFFDGPQGIRRLAPLAQRLAVSFPEDPQFDNPRAVQIRLGGFDFERLVEVGRKVRDLFASGLGEAGTRVLTLCDDAYLADLARAVAGELGGKVGVAPRLFLKKMVAEVLDPIELNPDFDPRRHTTLAVSAGEMNAIERAAHSSGELTAGGLTVDEIDLDL